MSENENQQEIVPVEINSEHRKEFFKANKRAFPNSFNYSTPVRERLG